MLTETPEPVVEEATRLPGQDYFNYGQSFITIEHVGHRADADSYTRSKKKTYLRKVTRQKKAKGKV